MASVFSAFFKYTTDKNDLYFKQVVQFSAAQLKQLIDKNGKVDTSDILETIQLNHNEIIFIFVFDEKGNEVTGRSLPDSKRSFLDIFVGNDTFSIQDGLKGYRLVGYKKYFPLRDVLAKQGVREVVTITLFCVSLIVSLLLSRFILRPISKLREASHRVIKGDLSVRIADTVKGRTDDIAKLAHEFDTMTERIEQLLDSQKRMMRDVSHELRSPLSRLQALFSISRQKLENNNPVNINDIDRMENESNKLNSLIENILVFAKLETQPQLNLRKTDIVDLLQVIADDASLEGAKENKNVKIVGESKLVCLIDDYLIHSAFENVIRNALFYSSSLSEVLVEVSVASDRFEVTVKDNGPGIKEMYLQKIFEPFFRADLGRTHNSSGGGIGLAIAARAVSLHNGNISAQNRNAGGLNVIISLPLVI